MAEQTENHKYNEPNKGATNWHSLLNENFRSLDRNVPIKDVRSNLSSYDPKENATFISTDTGEVFDGVDGTWQKAHRAYGGVGMDSESFDNVVFTNQGPNKWVVQTSEENRRYGTATEALQAAASNGGSIHLVDSIGEDDAISSTIVIDDDFRGPGVRGSGVVYVDGNVDTGFRFENGGRFENLWIRGQAGTTDLVVFRDVGRGSVIQDITCFRTNGNGMVFEGVQQCTVRNISFATCGDPASDTAELRLDNSPTDALETNAVNIQGFHSHGSNNPQGTCIQMRASNAGTDRPRNIHLSDVNIENGPSSAVPVIELCGRDNHIRGGRIMGIDDASTIFQLQGPRAPSMQIRDITAIGATGAPLSFVSNAAATAASSQSGGAIDDVPVIHGCDVDTDGVAINAPNFNQADDALKISDTDFNGSGGAIEVTASKDVGPGVILSNVDAGGQSISVQGTQLMVSNVHNATWSSHSAEFGPRLISDDGSFGPRFFSATTGNVTTGSGVAEYTFSGNFELRDGRVVATTDRGVDGTIVGTELLDSNADGDLDTVRAEVRTLADLTADAADGLTVDFTVIPTA